MQDKSQHFSDERRAGTDRRCWECKIEFPYIDSHGTLVTEDRRKQQRRETFRGQVKSVKSK